jgi:hypothetical protein
VVSALTQMCGVTLNTSLARAQWSNTSLFLHEFRPVAHPTNRAIS